MSTPTADGITVHRCVVRVVRHGGWSWGPDPRELVRQVINALPDLLAERFVEHLSGDGPDLEITEPVLLAVRLRRSRSPGHAVAPAFVFESTPVAGIAGSAPVPDQPTAVGHSLAELALAESSWTPPTCAMLFSELAERGELEPLLALLPDASLRMFLTALLDDLTLRDDPAEESSPVVSRFVAELARRLGSMPMTPFEVAVDPTLVADAAAGSLPAPDQPSTVVQPLGAQPLGAHFQAESFLAESSWTPSTLGSLLSKLAERGELEPLLALLPDTALRTCLATLLNDSAAEPSPAVSQLVAELARRLGSTSMASMPAARDDLIRLVEAIVPGSVAESPAISSSETPSTDLPDVDVPNADVPGVGVPSVNLPSANLPGVIVSGVGVPGMAVPGAGVPRAIGETRIGSVLPFLLAGPLARIGYLDAIGPALAGADQLDDAPLFAAALAYKVLGVPERGWRRTEQDDVAAAVFAGLDSVPDLVGFARRVRPVLPVLDGVLALSLCRGHDPAYPLLIIAVDGGLLLVDAQGMFPIAWAQQVSGLLPHWRACGQPTIVVCDSPLPPACLRELASAGAPFLTDVRPLRDDPVSRLHWRTPLWTSGSPDPQLAADLPGHTARLGELVRALVVSRRAAPLAKDGALERSTMLAASLGLGTIAWTLWRDREPPDPILALTRFANLEATVRFSPDAVHVRVPLGRRHADLLRCGALSDVPNVVWLGGRTLTFSGG